MRAVISARERRGWSWLAPFLPPDGVTCAQKNVHVLGPVLRLCRLSFRGDSVSRSSHPDPEFLNLNFASCTSAQMGRSGRTLVAVWRRASPDRAWLCPVSGSAGFIPERSPCPAVCGAQGACKSPRKIGLLTRYVDVSSAPGSHMYRRRNSSRALRSGGGLGCSRGPQLLAQRRAVPALGCSRMRVVRSAG